MVQADSGTSDNSEKSPEQGSDGIVIVQFDELGAVDFHVHGNVRLFIVDERAPHDRVHEWLPRSTGDEIAEIMGDDPIGSSQDERHAAIKHKIEALIDGRPRLAVVEPEKPD
jgi:hypothetical protein